MASKAIYILPAAIAIAGIGYVGWQWGDPPPVVVAPPDISTFDEFQQRLAARAKAMGRDADFQVVVTQAEAPIGAIMRKSSSVIKNDRACLPAEQPRQYNVPSLFLTTTKFSIATVAAARLGGEALAGLGTAGIRLDQNGTVDFNVSSAGMAQLSDDDITVLTDQPACRAALPRGVPVWLVRGYIAGKRSFALDIGNQRTGNIRFGRVGSVDIQPGSTTSSIAVEDAEPSRFLQVISEITLPEDDAGIERTKSDRTNFDRMTNDRARSNRGEDDMASSDQPTMLAAPVMIGTPVALASPGRIYFQQDRRDTSRTASRIQAALSAANYALAPGVDLIDETKMPSSAQVRYFRAEDLGRARAVAGIVARTAGPTREVRIYLPSPPGQLEVWLPLSSARR